MKAKSKSRDPSNQRTSHDSSLIRRKRGEKGSDAGDDFADEVKSVTGKMAGGDGDGSNGPMGLKKSGKRSINDGQRPGASQSALNNHPDQRMLSNSPSQVTLDKYGNPNQGSKKKLQLNGNSP